MAKFISVIIPTCHRNDLLSLCLDRLAPGQQTLGFEHYEVIVSDDGSESTAAEMIAEKYPWARWVEGPRRGPAANRNHGARQAGGEWLVFTDDDCLPDPHWLDAYYQAIGNTKDIYVFEGRTYADREKKRLDEESPVNETGGYLWSCNFCIAKSLFLKIGGFDESFPYAAMEDVDLHHRLMKMDQKILFIYDAAVCHPYRRTKKWSHLRKQYKSATYFIRKFPEQRKEFGPIYYLRALFNYIFRNLVKNFKIHKLRGWKYALTYMFHLLLNFVLSLGKILKLKF